METSEYSSDESSHNTSFTLAKRRRPKPLSQMESSPTQTDKKGFRKVYTSSDLDDAKRPKNWTKTPTGQSFQSPAVCSSPVGFVHSSPMPIPGRTPTRTPVSEAVIDDGNDSLFAGAKFNDPPSPESLPKPPIHWIENWECYTSPKTEALLHDHIALQLKTLLKVQH